MHSVNCSLRDTTECYFLVKSIKTFKYYFPVAILKIEQIQILDKNGKFGQNWLFSVSFKKWEDNTVCNAKMLLKLVCSLSESAFCSINCKIIVELKSNSKWTFKSSVMSQNGVWLDHYFRDYFQFWFYFKFGIQCLYWWFWLCQT